MPSEKELLEIAKRADALSKKRITLEKKHGVIDFFAFVCRENESLKVYIPIKKARGIDLKEGTPCHVVLGKQKVF